MIFINRVAKHRDIDQQQTDKILNDSENLFQPVHSPENQIKQTFEYNQPVSFLTTALSRDGTGLQETFQRIKIAGDIHDIFHIEDLDESVTPLLRALVIREKYY